MNSQGHAHDPPAAPPIEQLFAAAFDRTPEEVARYVTRLAIGLTGNRFDGEDLAQDVMEKVARLLREGRVPAISTTPERWLHRVMVNQHLDERRRATSLKRGGGTVIRLPADDGPSDTSGAASAEQEVLDQEGARTIRGLLDGLSPDDRMIIDLVIEGWTLTEIAAMTGRSTSAMKRRSTAIKALLRSRLDPALT